MFWDTPWCKQPLLQMRLLLSRQPSKADPILSLLFLNMLSILKGHGSWKIYGSYNPCLSFHNGFLGWDFDLREGKVKCGDLKSMVDIIFSCISGFNFIGARWKTIFLRIDKNVCERHIGLPSKWYVGCGDM